MNNRQKSSAFSLSSFTNIFSTPSLVTSPAGLPWYETLNGQDSVDMVYEYGQKAGEASIGMGYFLKRIRDKELFKELGYDTMAALAKDKFNMAESAVSRMVNLCEKYSENNNSPVLDSKYKEYNQSQLIEMLSIKDEKIIDEITPDTTVKEIREIKKKALNEPTDEDIRCFFNSCLKSEITPEEFADLKQYMYKKYRNSGAGGILDWKGSSRGIVINNHDEITWAKFVSRVYLMEDLVPDSIKKQSRKEPVKKEDATEEKEDILPGQMNITEDFPQYCPDNSNPESLDQDEIAEKINCDVAIKKEAEDVLPVIRDKCLLNKMSECNFHNIKEIAENCLDIQCTHDCCLDCNKKECGARCNTASAALIPKKIVIDGTFRELPSVSSETSASQIGAEDTDKTSLNNEKLDEKKADIDEPVLIEKEDVMIKYKCSNCQQQFILGQYAIVGVAGGNPFCPYCRGTNLEVLSRVEPGEIENMGSMSIWTTQY